MAAQKRLKYGRADIRNLFVPFIVESGGRFQDAARDFVDKLVGSLRLPPQQKLSKGHSIFRAVSVTLANSQAYMMTKLLADLHQAREDRRAYAQ